jgi:hypothetical protein
MQTFINMWCMLNTPCLFACAEGASTSIEGSAIGVHEAVGTTEGVAPAADTAVAAAVERL